LALSVFLRRHLPQSSFSVFDRRLLTEICAEQRDIHEGQHPMRLLTANNIEDEDDDEDDGGGEGSILTNQEGNTAFF
jgi:hypothetical protein